MCQTRRVGPNFDILILSSILTLSQVLNMEPTTPFSPHSFDYYPGSPDPQVPERKSFRFAGAPDGPLPDIPSGIEEESTESEPEVIVRRRIPRFKDPPVKPTWADFPYFCCLAMLFCTFGGVTFAVAIHKVTDLIMLTLQEVFHSAYEWLEIAEILSTASGCLISALSILTFSSTAISIYHQNLGGAAQLVFICLVYPSLFIWGFFVALSIACIFVSTVLNGVCDTTEISHIWTHWNPSDFNSICETTKTNYGFEKCVDCIDLYPFHFLFPVLARKEDMWLCGREIYLFCDEDLPQIVNWWITCLLASIMTFVGIIMHLYDLSYFRTTVKEMDKLKMGKELQYIRSHVKSALYQQPSRVNSSDVGLMLLNQTRQTE